MNTQPRGSRPDRDWALERAIVLQLLRQDRAPAWSRSELAAELGAEDRLIDVTLRALVADGVACEDAQTVSASRAAQRLDELELVAI